MKFSEYILEGRVEDFKSKFSQKFNQEVLNKMVSSIKPKYLMWAGSVLDPINLEENLGRLITFLSSFDKLSSNLTKTDINQYKSLNELVEEVNKYVNRQRRQYKQIEGGNVVYDNSRFLVVNPLSHQTSCYYGKGTKWCTAADSDHHFNNYNSDGKLFYILDKALPTSDKNYKVALLQKFDGESSFWDALDEKQADKWFDQHNPQAKQIREAINNYLENQFKEQLEIYRDKERARQERLRQEKMRIQRLVLARRTEADERRSTGEWDLTNPNIDEEGLKANAVFKYLAENEDYLILTNEDREKIQSLKSEIERLNDEYNESEDTRTDLLNSIEELEDELEDYDDYIDVYSLIPDGEYYDMSQFQIVDDLDKRYSVATSDEMESSARDYIEQLLDDVGYDGFRESFVRQFIDEEEVANYARSFYDDDVYGNPESYFEDSQRQLSHKQNDKILYNKQTIQKLESFIEKLEEALDETEDDEKIDVINERIEDTQEKIDELTEEIEEIQQDPDGDFPDELMEEKVDELVSDVENNPNWFMNDFGLNYKDYIDKDKFIQAVIDEDGYGIVNSYDGSVDEIYVNNQLFYVMRTD